MAKTGTIVFDSATSHGHADANRRVGMVLGAVVAALLAVLAAPVSAAADSWTAVGSPSPSSDAELYAVTCVQSSNCWAVGRYLVSTAYQTLIEHYDGSSWAAVSSPNTSTGVAQQLDGVACSSPTVCWAVGYVFGTQSSPSQTLIEENSGSGWSIVSSPNPSSTHNTLQAVTCTGVNNCSAVGDAQSGGISQTLILQYSGSAWSVASSPSSSSSEPNFLYGVACAGSTDCWATGSYTSSGSDLTLTLQNTGSGWAIVSSPNPSGAQRSYLNAVACATASDCVAAGFATTSNGYQTLIEQNTGSGWALVSSPSPGPQESFLQGVYCNATIGCRAVGFYFDSGGSSQPLVEENTGTTWTTAGVSGAPPNGALYGVSCAGTCWAAGLSGSSSGQTLVVEDAQPATVIPEWPVGSLGGLLVGGVVLGGAYLVRRRRRSGGMPCL